MYDALVAAGDDLGLRHAGYHAMDSLRIEKAYRSWGHDLGSEDTPLEAGLGFAVRLDKRGAVPRPRRAPARSATRRSAAGWSCFTLDDPEPLLYHDEPIWRDGALVGRITSGAYGHTIGRAIGLGYVEYADGVIDALRGERALGGGDRVRAACPRAPSSPRRTTRSRSASVDSGPGGAPGRASAGTASRRT